MLIEVLVVATLGVIVSSQDKPVESQEGRERSKETDWDEEFDKGLGLIDLGDE